MALTLYHLNASPPSRSVQMILELLGLEVEKKIINVVQKENLSPEYIQKNPLHTIPLLEDGDFLLADSHAIVTYLVSKYGAEKRATLYPSDLKVRAVIDQRLFFDASILFPRMGAITRRFLRQNKSGVTAEQLDNVIECYGFLEGYLDSSDFVATDNVTVADICCVATVSSLNCIIPIDEEYSKVHAWIKRLEREDWYQKENVPGLSDFANAVKMFNNGKLPVTVDV